MPIVLRRWTGTVVPGFCRRTVRCGVIGECGLDLHRCIPALAPGRPHDSAGGRISPGPSCALLDNFNVIEYGNKGNLDRQRRYRPRNPRPLKGGSERSPASVWLRTETVVRPAGQRRPRSITEWTNDHRFGAVRADDGGQVGPQKARRCTSRGVLGDTREKDGTRDNRQTLYGPRFWPM